MLHNAGKENRKKLQKICLFVWSLSCESSISDSAIPDGAIILLIVAACLLTVSASLLTVTTRLLTVTTRLLTVTASQLTSFADSSGRPTTSAVLHRPGSKHVLLKDRLLFLLSLYD